MVPILLFIFLQNPLGGYVRFEGYMRIDSEQVFHKLASTLQFNVSLNSSFASSYGAVNLIMDEKAERDVYIKPIEA